MPRLFGVDIFSGFWNRVCSHLLALSMLEKLAILHHAASGGLKVKKIIPLRMFLEVLQIRSIVQGGLFKVWSVCESHKESVSSVVLGLKCRVSSSTLTAYIYILGALSIIGTKYQGGRRMLLLQGTEYCEVAWILGRIDVLPSTSKCLTVSLTIRPRTSLVQRHITTTHHFDPLIVCGAVSYCSGWASGYELVNSW